jgi:adenylate cyclase
MATEIERKFLVHGTAWRSAADVGTRIWQGYLNRDKHRTVRVRVAGEKAFLTIKGLTQGATRAEFEYEIPLSDATALRALCDGPVIDKIRYRIPCTPHLVWEVDEFFGDNQGLVVAEIELESENQPFTLPDWLGAEVTTDARYYNANLAAVPYRSW